MIICTVDDIKPVATLSDNGRRLEVPLGGDTAEFAPGLQTHALVTIYQEETGAIAVGFHHSPMHVDLEEIPPRLTVFIDAYAIGPRRFNEGAVKVSYFAELIDKGKVVRQWSRTTDVMLVHE